MVFFLRNVFLQSQDRQDRISIFEQKTKMKKQNKSFLKLNFVKYSLFIFTPPFRN